MSIKRYLVYVLISGLAFVAAHYANFMMLSPNQVDIISYGALVFGVLGVAYNVLKSISVPENKEVFDNGKSCRNDPLNTSGLYRTVKYPALAGDFLMLLSISIYSALRFYPLAMLLLFFLMWIIDIRRLNNEYKEAYGEDYIKWEKDLSAFFPNIAKYRGMGKYSSWSKVNPWYPIIYGFIIAALHIYREYTVFQELEIQDMACIIALLSVLTTLFLLAKKRMAKD